MREAIALAVVQGLTEFLPISSSGHLDAWKRISGSELQGDLTVDVILHFATLLANKSLAKTFNREQLIMLQGQCLLRSGKKDDARKLFVASIEQFKDGPYKVAAIAAVADLSFSKADWDEVIGWTDRVVKSKPTPNANQLGRAFYQQGFAHHQQKKPEAAIASLVQIQPLKADEVWKTRASYLLGDCYSLTDQMDPILVLTRQVFRDTPLGSSLSDRLKGRSHRSLRVSKYRLPKS